MKEKELKTLSLIELFAYSSLVNCRRKDYRKLLHYFYLIRIFTSFVFLPHSCYDLTRHNVFMHHVLLP